MWKKIWKSYPVRYFRKVDELQSISLMLTSIKTLSNWTTYFKSSLLHIVVPSNKFCVTNHHFEKYFCVRYLLVHFSALQDHVDKIHVGDSSNVDISKFSETRCLSLIISYELFFWITSGEQIYFAIVNFIALWHFLLLLSTDPIPTMNLNWLAEFCWLSGRGIWRYVKIMNALLFSSLVPARHVDFC